MDKSQIIIMSGSSKAQKNTYCLMQFMLSPKLGKLINGDRRHQKLVASERCSETRPERSPRDLSELMETYYILY